MLDIARSGLTVHKSLLKSAIKAHIIGLHRWRNNNGYSILQKSSKSDKRYGQVDKAANPNGHRENPGRDIKPLQGYPGSYRLRVGDWRILFSYPASDVLLIEKIAPRGEVYKGV